MNNKFEFKKRLLLASLCVPICLYAGSSYGKVDLAYCSADASALFRQCEPGKDCGNKIRSSIRNAVQTFTVENGCFGKFEQYQGLRNNYDPANASLADARNFLNQLKQPIIDLKGQLSLVSASGQMSNSLRQELNKALMVFESRDYDEHTKDNGIFTKAYWYTAPQFGTQNIGIATDNSLADLELFEYLNQACASASEASSKCYGRFEEVRTTLRTTRTLSALFTFAGSFRVFIAEAYVDRLLDEWRYYFEEARVQYPWELGSDLDDVLEEARPGLLRAPRKQTFWLHPAAGVSYVEGAEDGQQLRPTAILELYGKNYWQFVDERDSRKVKLDGHAWGWSLITNYTDIQDIDDVGVGFSVHYDHKYTTSLTYHDDEEWVLSFNITLASHLQNLWQETKQTYEKKVKNAKTELKEKISELKEHAADAGL